MQRQLRLEQTRRVSNVEYKQSPVEWGTKGLVSPRVKETSNFNSLFDDNEEAEWFVFYFMRCLPLEGKI